MIAKREETLYRFTLSASHFVHRNWRFTDLLTADHMIANI
jgi:hypothetical protein